MRATSVKGVVFDLFHTLTGRETEATDLPATCDLLGVERGAWNQALLERSRWRLAGEERDPVGIIRTLAHGIDAEISEETVVKTTRIRMRRFRNALCRIPEEALETLDVLRERGYKIGLISNADTTEIAHWSEGLLAGKFDAEIFSCDVGLVKPEAEIFERCLAELDLTAEECLFVGDGGSQELEGAKAVGMQTVFVSGFIEDMYPDQIPARREIADHEIKTIPGVLDVLELVQQPG